MKNTFKLIEIIAMVAVIMFSMASCDDGSGGGGGGGGGGTPLSGTITITNYSGSPVTTSTVGGELYISYNGTETVSCQWQRGTTNVGTDYKYTPDQVGSYTVTVSAAGYQSKTSDPVTVTAQPELSGNIDMGDVVTVSIGGQFFAQYMENNASVRGDFQWKRDSTIVHVATDTYSSDYTPDQVGTYTVTFFAPQGRGYKTSEPVTVVATFDQSAVYGTWEDETTSLSYTLTVSADAVRLENSIASNICYLQYSDVTWTGMAGFQGGSTSYGFTGTRTSNTSDNRSLRSIALAADGQRVGIYISYPNGGGLSVYFTKQQ